MSGLMDGGAAVDAAAGAGDQPTLNQRHEYTY